MQSLLLPASDRESDAAFNSHHRSRHNTITVSRFKHFLSADHNRLLPYLMVYRAANTFWQLFPALAL